MSVHALQGQLGDKKHVHVHELAARWVPRSLRVVRFVAGVRRGAAGRGRALTPADCDRARLGWPWLGRMHVHVARLAAGRDVTRDKAARKHCEATGPRPYRGCLHSASLRPQVAKQGLTVSGSR